RTDQAQDNLTPFAPHGWRHFGAAVLPIFWAFAGFELAVMPSGEVKDPQSTLPRGVMLGMTVAGTFYLLTIASLVLALPSDAVASSVSPLADALDAMLKSFGVPGGVGSALIAIGASISIVGVFDVYMLGVSRLSLALSRDGFFPGIFGREHSKFRTPEYGLLFQAALALTAASLFDLRGLVSISVVFLSVPYFFTALAAFRLAAMERSKALKIPGLRGVLLLGALAALYLAAQASTEQVLIGAAAIGAGLLLYWWQRESWKTAAGRAVRREEADVQRWLGHQHWLARSYGSLRAMRASWGRRAGSAH
ncbi:MAG TPA: APC family permease, partial [Dehalococcoidia bacterium]